jgi:hypothetical protein
MTSDEILEDIKFIFQGHLNFKFNHEILPKNFVIQQRQLIDDTLNKLNFPIIILKDIFKNWKLMEILDNDSVKSNKIDLNHFSKNAIKEISRHFIIILK